ncbi:flavodoxin domain-containing protein [Pseudorhodoferax sp.]|uniref:flavodoxin domain-containing protein n=1 Tax=Pseudorhodoferax sp. TaxID=1993553 RepID=UPI002DD62604|nr:flavodoxin domain-containing protein [Pseudorhodoferax sp.]
MARQQLHLLVATVTGTAQVMAEDLMPRLTAEFDVRLHLAEDVDSSVFRAGAPLLVFSSTYGKGEVPDPGKPLYEALRALDGGLEGLRYGVVSLGDAVYAQTFANGGRLWDKALQAHGAVRLTPLLVLDASAPADPAAALAAWVDLWLAELRAQALAPEGTR